MPGRRQRSGLGFAVSDHAGDDQVGIVEGRAIGMGEAIAKLAALVDRARGLRRDVAGNAAGETELLEQTLHADRVLRNPRIDFAVDAVEPSVGHKAGPPMSRAGNVDHVEVVRFDDAIQVDIDEIEPRRRAPVPEQPRLHVLEAKRRLSRAGCRADRSARPKDSWRRATRRRYASPPPRKAGRSLGDAESNMAHSSRRVEVGRRVRASPSSGRQARIAPQPVSKAGCRLFTRWLLTLPMARQVRPAAGGVSPCRREGAIKRTRTQAVPIPTARRGCDVPPCA